MAQKTTIYVLQTCGGSSAAQPLAIDENGCLKAMLYAVSVAGGSSSAQPVYTNVDGQIGRP